MTLDGPDCDRCWVVSTRSQRGPESLPTRSSRGSATADRRDSTAAGGDAAIVRRRWRSPWSRAAGVKPRRRHRVVATTMFASAYCSRSRRNRRRNRDAAVRRHPRPSDTDLIPPLGAALVAAWQCVDGAHGRLLAPVRPGWRRALGSPGLRRPALLSCWQLDVVAVQLGNLLVVAVFVGPAAAARTSRSGRSDDRRRGRIAVLAGLAGLYLSYYVGTAPAPRSRWRSRAICSRSRWAWFAPNRGVSAPSLHDQ